MAQEVDLEAFRLAHAAGAFVLDVREPAEYAAGHVPGARLIPLMHVLGSAGELPQGRPVYVVCASGNRSKSATDWLRAAGVEAYSVAGGTSGWAQLGGALHLGATP
jgi:rhodanese-related sulfurtransferase